MYKQQGITHTLLLFVLLLALVGMSVWLYIRQINGVSKVVPNTTKQRNSSFENSLTQGVVPTTSTSASINSWAITSEPNIEFLITSPSGQKTGYLEESNSYIEGIPNAYYGIEGGIADATGQNPPSPYFLSFGLNNPENGIYLFQILSRHGKQPGSYHLRVIFMRGSGAELSEEDTLIDGMLTTNQVDNFTITIPSGTIQKIGN